MKKYLRQLVKMKYLCWLVVSEVSVHGPLAPSLWPWGKAGHHHVEHMAEQDHSPHGIGGAKRKNFYNKTIFPKPIKL
jgi:hypothetical protein